MRCSAGDDVEDDDDDVYDNKNEDRTRGVGAGARLLALVGAGDRGLCKRYRRWEEEKK